MTSGTGLSLCFVLVAILWIGSKPAVYGATAIVFIYLPDPPRHMHWVLAENGSDDSMRHGKLTISGSLGSTSRGLVSFRFAALGDSRRSIAFVRASAMR